MTSLSKADYLKRYLSAEDGNSGSDLKKKKRKKEKSSKQRVGMRIVEDDAFASVAAGAGEKKVIASDEEEEIEMIQELVKTKIQAPKFKNAFTTVETPTSSSVPSKRHDSDSDPEPPRRRRHDSDKSPPRRRRHDSDEDSPPKSTRRRRNDSDQSPVRHPNSNRKDESPVRKRGRHASDSSPPRRTSRKRHDSDDQEPPRRGARNEDQSPPRRTRRDSDASPPRRRLQSPRSPPPRNGRRVQSPTVEKEKMATTLDGKVAGLQTAKALKEESDKLRQRETMLFEEMDTATSGRGADTVVRQKQIKRGRREEPEDKEKKEREAKKQEELTSKYKDWNRGVKQLQEREAQLYEMARVAAEPVARRADDDEMNRHLKEVIHEADPMAAMITRRKREDAIDRGDLVYPQYTRPYPPNRFHIRPGYRWDGVDRSNGFEGKLAMAGNKKKAQNTEFYQNIQCYE